MAALDSAVKTSIAGTVVAAALAGCDIPQDVPLPLQESQFIRAASVWQRDDADNEIAEHSHREARRKALCELFNGHYVASGWIGTIKEIRLSFDGKGAVAVEIAPGITVETWNNMLSDITDRTRVDPSDELYRQLESLQRGGRVVFSGRFFKDKEDCIRENSMTTHGSLTEPEFLFRFSALSAQ
jgi:hypothetical protein